MKTKKFVRKLKLNKKTIADLNSKEMKNVHGGDLESKFIGLHSGCYICSNVIPCR